MEHPIFFASCPRGALRTSVPASGPTCQAAECAGCATLAIHQVRGGSDGEESSQGREEEGGEEAIAAGSQGTLRSMTPSTAHSRRTAIASPTTSIPSTTCPNTV